MLKQSFVDDSEVQKSLLSFKINLRFKKTFLLLLITIILFTIIKVILQKLAYLDITFFLHNANLASKFLKIHVNFTQLLQRTYIIWHLKFL
jgi:hypothetical protein